MEFVECLRFLTLHSLDAEAESIVDKADKLLREYEAVHAIKTKSSMFEFLDSIFISRTTCRSCQPPPA